MKSSFSILIGLVFFAFIAFAVGRYVYFKPKFVNGESVPNFTSTTIGGAPFELSDLHGNYVLVDFWGSWCGPCRKESPELVQFYQKYKDAQFTDAKGFELVSVAIERNANSWKKAIQRDGLNWKYHIMDENKNMKFFDAKIASLFGVKEVPSKYLLNEEGVIIGVNLSFEQMANLLDRRKKG